MSVDLLILFAVPLLAGVALIFWPKTNPKHLQNLTLAGAGYLLAVVASHFLPELYGQARGTEVIWFVVGVLLQIELQENVNISSAIPLQRRRKWAGLQLFAISLCAHAFTEGMLLVMPDTLAHAGHAHHHHHAHDAPHPLLWGILLHKVPMVAALVTAFLQAENFPKKGLWGWLLAFVLSAPLGMWSMNQGVKIFEHGLPLAIQFFITGMVLGLVLHLLRSPASTGNWGRRIALFLGAGVALLYEFGLSG
jgi:zinc transporter ZupT